MRTSMMMFAALALSLAACATDETYEGDTLPGPTVQKIICPTGCDDLQQTLDNGQWIPIADGAFARANTRVAPGGYCSALPATGQCAFACDPAGFAQTLPFGTCAAVRCPLPDGGEVVVGGCN